MKNMPTIMELLRNKDSKEYAEWLYKEPMKPCPKCGSYKMRYRTPIKMDDIKKEDMTAKRLLSEWAKQMKKGPILEGYGYMICEICHYHSKHVDTHGMSYEEARNSKDFADKIKENWNNGLSEEI